MSRLEFEDLSVEVGTGRNRMTAVDGVSLEVPAGRVVGLVGESGSGKSTIARAAVGLVDPSAGAIRLEGEDVARLGAGRRRIQMVFQDPRGSLDPRMSVGDSIAEAFSGEADRRTVRAEVGRRLEQVGLDPGSAGLLPRALSGGQRQRVALARALAAEPDVVIADEITSALDVSVQGSVLNLLRRLQLELGFSMLFISHNLAVVRYISEEIAVMHLGRIVERAPTADLVGSPLHPYTRVLLESIPRLGEPLDAGDPAGFEEDTAIGLEARGGCRFRGRCPVGPAAREDRALCIDSDPQADAAKRPHTAACHFVEAPAPAGRTQ